MPCTTILVGKKASYDGSTIIARNDDSGSGHYTSKKLAVIKPEEQPKIYKSVISHVEIELPENPMRYTAMPNAEEGEGIWAACGVNEAHVGMTATETITSNPRVLGADPLVRYQPAKDGKEEIPGGIGEEDIVYIVLPYIHSAREGVKRLGSLLEQYGTYEMNGIAFQDADEIWWLETIGGHHWIARKVPDDVYVMMPNQFGMDQFDLEDAHRLKTLYESFLGRMDSAQRAAWEKFYGPIIEDFYKKNPQGKDLANWKFQRYMRDYMKTVKSLDDNVGRVLDYLKEKGLLENTLVVYTSDQGFYMGEHGWFDKRFMYEESMRTPLIMRLPDGFTRRGDITEMVQNIDYGPTFLDLAGVEIPSDMHGVSLLPLLKGEHPKDWRKALYYHFYEYPAEHMVKRHYGVRTDRYKLIHFYNDIDTWELYDLQADPHEMHNLYGQKEYEAVVDELKAEMLKLQEQYDDPVRFSPERDKE